ncbi:MAG TPA: MOSC domain-containing protein [Haliangiales bacterium]|nr:MOSC domain-containing protein [Haliangiales bacterium]
MSIFLTPTGGAPMREVREARAEIGVGLAGDRYAGGAGTFSRTVGSGRHVTLIEIEALAAAERDYDLAIAPALTRRNLLVSGVALNHLVGKEFQVGEVRLLGTRLCEPCNHMEELSGIAGARKALIHRGGLRCDVVRGGTLRAGDAVVV